MPPPVSPGELPIFRDAVDSGGIDPDHYAAFWVEAGALGGGWGRPGNQLELPRDANRFFGFSFNNYDDHARYVIGEIDVTTSSGSWDCRLAWHGDNGMERIYLPTTARSGLVYSHRVVLFQRSGTSFELTVSEPDWLSCKAMA